MSEKREGGRARRSRRSRRGSALDLAVRAALVVLLVVGAAQAFSAVTYRTPRGSVTMRVRPAWPGGRLVMPLGPAGEFALHTHRTPFDIVMEYRLPAETAALTAGGGIVDDLPALQDSARAAFSRYLVGRIPWVLVAGAAAGALVAGSGTRRRRLLWGAAAGAAAVALLAATAAAVTYATVDRSPAVEYRGLASNVPRVLPLLRALGSGEGGDRLRGLQDFIDGLETVATQLTVAPQQHPRAEVTRLLLVSDVHDNVFGMRAAARLAAGGGSPVDGVLVAGDVTNYGFREEAQLFVRAFDAVTAPVVFVGGNHEDAPALAALSRAGYLDAGGTEVDVAGVLVAGEDDPLARSARVDSDPELLAADASRLADRWAALSPAPQVLLVHDLRQAQDVVAAAREAGEDLVVAYGNDHVAGVRRDGSVVLIDAGTAGASGYGAIGSVSPGAASADPAPAPGGGLRGLYTFQLLDFSLGSRPALLAVTTLGYAGDGRTVVEYTPVGE